MQYFSARQIFFLVKEFPEQYLNPRPQMSWDTKCRSTFCAILPRQIVLTFIVDLWFFFLIVNITEWDLNVYLLGYPALNINFRVFYSDFEVIKSHYFCLDYKEVGFFWGGGGHSGKNEVILCI